MNPAKQPDGPFAQRRQHDFEEELLYLLEELEEMERAEVNRAVGMTSASTMLEAEVYQKKLDHVRMLIRMMD